MTEKKSKSLEEVEYQIKKLKAFLKDEKIPYKLRKDAKDFLDYWIARKKLLKDE